MRKRENTVLAFFSVVAISQIFPQEDKGNEIAGKYKI
jgi:hypothetical protein